MAGRPLLALVRCGLALGVLSCISTGAAAADATGTEAATGKADAPVPFKVDHDAPLEPAERLDRAAEGFIRLRVEFNGIRGDRVPAFLYLPTNADARGGADAEADPAHPAVLLQYGSGGNKNTNYIVALGERFAARGFIVLTIDAPLRGERRPRRDLGWRRLFTDIGRVPWYLGDYSRAIDYLLTRREVDARRVGYAGISWGAITGITFVAHEPRVRAIASIVGGGNFLGQFDAQASEAAREAARRIDPVHHVARIAPRPLLLMNVTRDQLVPRFYAESLHAAAGEAETVTKVWLDTDHFFNGLDRRAVLDQVVDFMENALR